MGAKPEELLISLGSEQDGSAEYSRIIDFDGGGKLYMSGGYMFHHERSGGYVGAQQEWAVGNPEWHHGGRITGPNSRLTAVYTDTENLRVWARYYNAQYDNQYLQGIVGADVFDNGVANTDGSATEDSEGNPTVTDNDGNAIPDWAIEDNARGIVKSRRHFNENLSVSADKTYDLGDGQSVKVVFGHTVSHSGMERASTSRFGRNNPPWAPGQDGSIQWNGHMMDGIGESRTRLRGDYTNKNENHPVVVGAEIRFDQYGDNFIGRVRPLISNGVTVFFTIMRSFPIGITPILQRLVSIKCEPLHPSS